LERLGFHFPGRKAAHNDVSALASSARTQTLTEKGKGDIRGQCLQVRHRKFLVNGTQSERFLRLKLLYIRKLFMDKLKELIVQGDLIFLVSAYK